MKPINTDSYSPGMFYCRCLPTAYHLFLVMLPWRLVNARYEYNPYIIQYTADYIIVVSLLTYMQGVSAGVVVGALAVVSLVAVVVIALLLWFFFPLITGVSVVNDYSIHINY